MKYLWKAQHGSVLVYQAKLYIKTEDCLNFAKKAQALTNNQASEMEFAPTSIGVFTVLYVLYPDISGRYNHIEADFVYENELLHVPDAVKKGNFTTQTYKYE